MYRYTKLGIESGIDTLLKSNTILPNKKQNALQSHRSALKSNKNQCKTETLSCELPGYFYSGAFPLALKSKN